ncbi:hypothetical protein [Streptomyces sp. NBC_01353]|uniref:hypothetical protein n=1 Tax=Streptomyces sp. NBC_01353 TaxID=2903835 RepID=UPI003DA34EBF
MPVAAGEVDPVSEARLAAAETVGSHLSAVRGRNPPATRLPVRQDASGLACLADRQAKPKAAGHPYLPPQVIAELLTDADQQVVEAAAANPSLPLAAMAKLVPCPPRL